MTVAPRLLAEQQCSFCEEKKADELPTCAGCKVVSYCSKEHQQAHWPAHKKVCTPVKKARNSMADEEAKLRNHPGDFMMPADPFSQPGHFWGWWDTRPYMRAKATYIDNIRKIRTQKAIATAHDEIMDVFRLNRSDNMGMRDGAPALMMRLGKDQEAYDFMKWHATTGNDMHYDWGDMDLPFLDLHGEDVFEPVAPLLQDPNGLELSHLVAMTLLKLRLLLDLYSLKNSTQVAKHLPQELLDHVRKTLVGNTVASNHKILQEVRDGVDISPRIRNVEAQVSLLFEEVSNKNAHFWPAVVDPGRNLSARPEYFSQGDQAEMQIMLQHNYEAWRETPGAIAWVEDRLKTHEG